MNLPQDPPPASHSTGSVSVQLFLPWVCVESKRGTHSSCYFTETQKQCKSPINGSTALKFCQCFDVDTYITPLIPGVNCTGLG